MAKPEIYELVKNLNAKFDNLIENGISADLSEVMEAIANTDAKLDQILDDLNADEEAGEVPVVTSVSPSSGSVNGGEIITITGTGFLGAEGVLFGVASGSNLAIESDTSLTVTSPTLPAGTVDVVVVDEDGDSTSNEASKFTAS